MRLGLWIGFLLASLPAVVMADSVQTPALGKWMLQASGEPAHWVGIKYQERTLDEPINVVIRVQAAGAKAAVQRLIQSAAKAGFVVSSGHSAGYFATIGGKLLPEVPNRPGVAFSDGSFMGDNDHGRFFGPVLWKTDGFYYFVGALSREGGAGPLSIFEDGGVSHAFLSFRQARNVFVNNMRAAKVAKIVGSVFLGNLLSDGGPETTGDHDGFAIVLEI